MKCIHAITIAVLAATMPATTASKADLIKADTAQFGQNSLTVDTSTRLAWLNLTLSCDLSYVQVVSALQPGQLFDGYRYATSEEVVSLFNSAGFSPGFIAETNASYPNITALISLMGATEANTLTGITGSLDGNGADAWAYLAYLSQGSIGSSAGTERGYFVSVQAGTMNTTAYGLNTHYPTVGNWLVAVPEPSTYGLWLAAGVLALFRRKRK